MRRHGAPWDHMKPCATSMGRPPPHPYQRLGCILFSKVHSCMILYIFNRRSLILHFSSFFQMDIHRRRKHHVSIPVQIVNCSIAVHVDSVRFLTSLGDRISISVAHPVGSFSLHWWFVLLVFSSLDLSKNHAHAPEHRRVHGFELKIIGGMLMGLVLKSLRVCLRCWEVSCALPGAHNYT